MSGGIGDTVTFRSEDGSLIIEATIIEPDKSREIHTPYYSIGYQKNGSSDNSLLQKFNDTAVTVSRPVSIDALPFTLSFSEDTDSVTLTVKENIGTYWSFAEATYRSSSPDNIWETRNAQSGETSFVLPIWDTYSHNIAFNVYNDTPYASQTRYDLMFRVEDGQIYWSNHSRYEQYAQDMTGDEAKAAIEEMIAMDFY